MNREKNVLAEREFTISLILITGYLFIQLLANLTVNKYTPLVAGLAIPVGSLLYAISFTWIDLVNDYLGKTRARKLVLAAIGANIFAIIWFQLYIALPGSSSSFAQKAIEFVLGGYWRIYAASIITGFISENTDITIFHYDRWYLPQAPRWVRALASNTVAGPLDSALFSILAFAGTIPGGELWSIILGGAIYKLIVGYVSIPALYLVKARHDRRSISTEAQV